MAATATTSLKWARFRADNYVMQASQGTQTTEPLDLPKVPAGPEAAEDFAAPLPPMPAELLAPSFRSGGAITKAGYPVWLKVTAILTSLLKLLALIFVGFMLYVLSAGFGVGPVLQSLLPFLAVLALLPLIQVVASIRNSSLTLLITSGILAALDLLLTLSAFSTVTADLADGGSSGNLGLELLLLATTFCQTGVFLGALKYRSNLGKP